MTAHEISSLVLVTSPESAMLAKHASGDAPGRVILLSLDPDPPHLVNRFAHLPGVSRWEEFGVTDLSLSRFWIFRYPEIDAEILDVLARTSESIPEPLLTSHFRFGLAWKLGSELYDPLMELDGFFNRVHPGEILAPGADPKLELIMTVIRALAKRHGIPVRTLAP